MIKKAIRRAWSTTSKVTKKAQDLRCRIGISSSGGRDLDLFKLAQELALASPNAVTPLTQSQSLGSTTNDHDFPISFILLPLSSRSPEHGSSPVR